MATTAKDICITLINDGVAKAEEDENMIEKWKTEQIKKQLLGDSMPDVIAVMNGALAKNNCRVIDNVTGATINFLGGDV